MELNHAVSTYKVLEDYAEVITPEEARVIGDAIRRDRRLRIIDESNFEELMEDLRDELMESSVETTREAE